MKIASEVIFMHDKSVYITLNHMDQFIDSPGFFKVGEELTLKKDKDNEYDDEAIIAYKENMKCAYVANSVHTVARGTSSAGRIYDLMEGEAKCIIRFILMEEGVMIGEAYV